MKREREESERHAKAVAEWVWGIKANLSTSFFQQFFDHVSFLEPTAGGSTQAGARGARSAICTLTKLPDEICYAHVDDGINRSLQSETRRPC